MKMNENAAGFSNNLHEAPLWAGIPDWLLDK